MKTSCAFTVLNEQAMLQIAKNFSQVCLSSVKKTIIFLDGPLGAGKTTFVRGVLSAMGYKDTVKSPTYTLVEEYIIFTTQVYHFDFYRVLDPEELEFIGVHEYFSASAICFVEWPEKGQGFVPKPDITVNIQCDDVSRKLLFVASSKKGQTMLLPFWCGC